jgi:hypothetical protein
VRKCECSMVGHVMDVRGLAFQFAVSRTKFLWELGKDVSGAVPLECDDLVCTIRGTWLRVTLWLFGFAGLYSVDKKCFAFRCGGEARGCQVLLR